jgi:SAM-dependent methyltransferase
VEDWLLPLRPDDFAGKDVLELGCGSASILAHVLDFHPRSVTGVDLGDAVLAAERNLRLTGYANWEIHKQDLASFASPGFDIVYCVGVLHHMKNPRAGLASVIGNTKPGGRFHAWVYGFEGNAAVRILVDPLRRVCSRLPWRITKYAIAAPLAFAYLVLCENGHVAPRGRGEILPDASLQPLDFQKGVQLFPACCPCCL